MHCRPVIYLLTETETETNIISLSETERETEMICITETKYKRKSEHMKRNSNWNENDFKTKMMDLECHLQQMSISTSSAPLNLTMLADMRSRFSSLLCPQSSNFNPLPAAACLLDHTVASVLLTADQQLIEAAKLYFISEVCILRVLRDVIKHISFLLVLF